MRRLAVAVLLSACGPLARPSAPVPQAKAATRVVRSGALLASPVVGPRASPPRAAKPLINSYGDLIALITGAGGGAPVRSVDALLDRFAADYPDNLQSFSLVYASRSLQTASVAFPRVILFGAAPSDQTPYQSATRLVLAFTGDPSRPDFAKLEVMSLDAGAANLRLAEITFPGDGSGGAPLVEEQPARCATCHGTPARPLWDSYPVWPGVYGSIDDALDAQTTELADFRAFAAKVGQPGRYRRLQLATEPSAFDQGGAQRQTLALSGKPNLNLTTVLSRLNFLRLAQSVVALPRYQPLRYAFLGAVGECLEKLPDPAAWFPGGAAATFGITPESVKAVMIQDGTANNTAKLRRFFNVHGQVVPPTAAGELFGFDVDDAPRIAYVRYLSLLAGDDMRTWSTSLTPRAFSFATGAFGIVDFSEQLLDAAKADPGVAAFLAAGGEQSAGPPVQLDCARLAALSKAAVMPADAAALAAAAPQAAAALQADGMDQQQLILRCMSCHTDPLLDAAGQPVPSPDVTPYFPFHQPLALGQLLTAPGGGWLHRMQAAIAAPAGVPWRMPKAPLAPSSAAEKNALTDMMASLAAGTPVPPR